MVEMANGPEHTFFKSPENHLKFSKTEFQVGTTNYLKLSQILKFLKDSST